MKKSKMIIVSFLRMWEIKNVAEVFESLFDSNNSKQSEIKLEDCKQKDSQWMQSDTNTLF